jgi:GrpB-like predicted nucleotidyltransferase (UPF0157 family)
MAVTLVQKYNSEWPKWFEEIKAFLGEKMSQACIRIEHVGSTSIPGMTAKPIIDLILVIEPKRFGEIKSLLEERGYYHKGDLDIKEREVFDLKDEAVKKSVPNHHLYVCLEHSAELKKETAFREFLKRNKKYADKLSDLKWSLAEKFDNDKYPYMDGKAALCREITEKALLYQQDKLKPGP